MGDSSSKVLQLRPVTFYYKPEYDDGSRLSQYGLVAEEVARVYPEMVSMSKTASHGLSGISCSRRCCSTSCKSRPRRIKSRRNTSNDKTSGFEGRRPKSYRWKGGLPPWKHYCPPLRSRQIRG